VAEVIQPKLAGIDEKVPPTIINQKFNMDKWTLGLDNR